MIRYVFEVDYYPRSLTILMIVICCIVFDKIYNLDALTMRRGVDQPNTHIPDFPWRDEWVINDCRARCVGTCGNFNDHDFLPFAFPHDRRVANYFVVVK